MERSNADFDIVKNLAIIEKLKCNLLSCTADLFSGMTAANTNAFERKDLLAEIIISAYLLSRKLGIDFEGIDKEILDKLKIGILDDSNLSTDKSVLYKYMNDTKHRLNL